MPQIQNHKTNRSIARKLILYVILFSSLITLLITAAQLYYDYSKELDSIHNSLDQIEKVHLKTLSGDVWAVDRQSAKIQLDGILKVPDLEYIEIRENDELWLNTGIQRSRNVIEKTFPIKYFTRGEYRNLGQLKVVATLDNVYNRLLNKALTIFLSNAVKTFLVAGFMLILFYRLVTRHIQKIASFVEQHDIDSENLDKLVLENTDNTSGEENELVALCNHLNAMQEKINASYSKIKASEEKYRRLVELAQEGIWTIDEKGETIFVNPSMANMLGYSVEEMLGKHLFDFMDEHGKEIAASNMERRRSGIHESHDFEFLRKDGRRIYATLATAPIFDSNGKYTGAIAGVMDITARIEAEKRLLMDQQLLEDTVHDRTRALEVSNKELEAFSYSVAHDLRTPLRSITSFSQILKEEENDNISAEGKLNLERIIRAGKSMSRLIDELLELSRISRAEIVYDDISLSQTANNILNSLITETPDRKCKIHIADNMHIKADKTLIEILLVNLLHNAWKFTKEKEISNIEFGEEYRDGEPVFYIKDNGIGFDMKYKHKLFEAFQRLHGADYSGNGIGLATVKRIVNRHGGKVWAEAKENAGATFYFTIPDKHRKTPVTANIEAGS